MLHEHHRNFNFNKREEYKYKQGKNGLRLGVSHCCLGVACDLIDPNKWSIISNSTFYLWMGSSTTIPLNEASAIGLRSDQMDKLFTMNDGDKSFAEIADWIEANL